jgi:hypothetical protein
MAKGFRIFFVHEDGALRRIPMTRFERLYLRNDKNERFPEYARQRVRYALVVLELKNKKPVAVERIDCSVITFRLPGKGHEARLTHPTGATFHNLRRNPVGTTPVTRDYVLFALYIHSLPEN